MYPLKRITIADLLLPMVRLWPLVVMFVLCFSVVLYLNPTKAGLTLYGIGKIALGGLIGFMVFWCIWRVMDWLGALDGISLGVAQKCMAWIISAAILAMALVP